MLEKRGESGRSCDLRECNRLRLCNLTGTLDAALAAAVGLFFARLSVYFALAIPTSFTSLPSRLSLASLTPFATLTSLTSSLWRRLALLDGYLVYTYRGSYK